jgi:hypothetical protein
MVENGPYLLIAAKKIGDRRFRPQGEFNTGRLRVFSPDMASAVSRRALLGMVPALKPAPPSS